MNATYHVRVGRVVLTGEAIDGMQARRLRQRIVKSLETELSSGPLPPPATADNVRIDLPAFALTSPEGERRAAHAAAAAIGRAVRGERP